MTTTLNSEEISGLMCMPFQGEPDYESTIGSSGAGIFVGNSQRFSMPVFINLETALNPHMLICGMTGGGKTFLARSIVTRLHLFSEASVAVIDFTGEYSSVVSNLSIESDDGISGLFGEPGGIFYMGLHGLKEREKVARASDALDHIAETMRTRKSGFNRRVFVLLDEAWKLVENNRGLEVIIREGRKYGVGLITSSQLLHDTNSNILSNIATIFVFKTTNKSSLERLARSYNLSDADLLRIQNLDMGSCFIIQLHKSGARSAFQVRKVIGIRESEMIGINSGINMEIRIEREKLEAAVGALCGTQKSEILRGITESESIELTKLITQLIGHGADRSDVLGEVKKMGFSDSDIADSFSLALNVVADGTTENR